MLKEKYKFIRCAAKDKTTLILSIRSHELDAKELTHSYFVLYQNGKWSNICHVDWNTQAMCVATKPSNKVVVVARKGQVTVMSNSDTSDEIIEKPYSIRNVTTIDGYAYACGIDRQVFKRVAENKWQPMHAPDSRALKETHGFEAIAGFSENDIYAVGWIGEIWHYDGSMWTQEKSPATVILTAVVCAPDATVYAAGQNGTLLQRKNGEWKAINKRGYIGDIWSMCWFNDKLYAATMERVLVLEDSKLVPVDTGTDVPDTCYHLTAAEGVLWSIGTDDIFSFDGETWTRIE